MNITPITFRITKQEFENMIKSRVSPEAKVVYEDGRVYVKIPIKALGFIDVREEGDFVVITMNPSMPTNVKQ